MCNDCKNNPLNNCTCKKSTLYQLCPEETTNYVQNCISTACQIDAKNIIYKKNDVCDISYLDNIDVPTGSNLEYILERLAYYIENNNYFEIFENPYNAKDFKSFYTGLTSDINKFKDIIVSQQKQISELETKIKEIDIKLNNIFNPNILDKNGIGFTKYDNILTVVQTIANNV